MLTLATLISGVVGAHPETAWASLAVSDCATATVVAVGDRLSGQPDGGAYVALMVDGKRVVDEQYGFSGQNTALRMMRAGDTVKICLRSTSACVNSEARFFEFWPRSEALRRAFEQNHVLLPLEFHIPPHC